MSGCQGDQTIAQHPDAGNPNLIQADANPASPICSTVVQANRTAWQALRP